MPFAHLHAIIIICTVIKVVDGRMRYGVAIESNGDSLHVLSPPSGNINCCKHDGRGRPKYSDSQRRDDNLSAFHLANSAPSPQNNCVTEHSEELLTTGKFKLRATDIFPCPAGRMSSQSPPSLIALLKIYCVWYIMHAKMNTVVGVYFYAKIRA